MRMIGRLFLVLGLLLLHVARAQAAVALVNTASAANYAASAGSIATPATSLTAGNLIVVAVRVNAQTVSTVTDTASNTYTFVIRTSISGTDWELWYSQNVSGNASNVVTATYAGNQNGRAIITAQFSGASAYTAVTFKSNAYSGSTTLTDYITTNMAAGLMIVAPQVNDQCCSWTTPSGYSTTTTTTGNVATMFWQEFASVQSAVTISVVSSSGSSKDMVMMFLSATYAPASSGASSYAFAQ